MVRELQDSSAHSNNCLLVATMKIFLVLSREKHIIYLFRY